MLWRPIRLRWQFHDGRTDGTITDRSLSSVSQSHTSLQRQGDDAHYKPYAIDKARKIFMKMQAMFLRSPGLSGYKSRRCYNPDDHHHQVLLPDTGRQPKNEICFGLGYGETVKWHGNLRSATPLGLNPPPFGNKHCPRLCEASSRLFAWYDSVLLLNNLKTRYYLFVPVYSCQREKTAAT
jgi:hypothetical protein